jgi:hypothetical protein
VASVEQTVLTERLTKLRAQRDELATQLNRLDQARGQAQASLNAVIGAIAVLEDLSAAPPTEPAPEKPRRRRALANGDARTVS